jgi:hypothetical protein
MIASLPSTIPPVEPVEEIPALLEEACQFAKRSPQIPGVAPPYIASSLISNGRRYYYVAGSDNERRSRLVEVFAIKPTGELEPIPTFLYPEPIRELFATDLSVLFAADPWGGEVASLTTAQIADGLLTMNLDERRRGKRKRKSNRNRR